MSLLAESMNENESHDVQENKPIVDDAEISVHESLYTKFSNFKTFELKRVIADNSQRKSIVFEGSFEGKDGTALIVLEKKPFTKDILDNILKGNSNLQQDFVNDIYGGYECYPPAEFSGIKTTIIHPATAKHITRFEIQPTYIITETPDLYSSITQLHLDKEQFSLQWLYNVLEHKSEVDRIVFEDPDDDIGFILLPDLKWNTKQVEDLYLLGIVRQKGIKSLRDLTVDHLPLLQNLYDQGKKAIEEIYKLPGSQLRIYIHYQPSFYHLHVHFTYLKFDAPGIFTERSHLLSTVINNIELFSDYYQRATLPFVVKETDNLFIAYEKAGKAQRAIPAVSSSEKITN